VKTYSPSTVRSAFHLISCCLRDLVAAFLPADQSHALAHAATAVTELHAECIANSLHPALHNPQEEEGDLLSIRQTHAEILISRDDDGSSNINNSELIVDIILSCEEDQSPSTNMLNKAVLADPAGTIFSAPENVLTNKRNFAEDGATGHLVHRDRDSLFASAPHSFFGERSAVKYSSLDMRKKGAPSESEVDKDTLLVVTGGIYRPLHFIRKHHVC
jgi:hypothetical protein